MRSVLGPVLTAQLSRDVTPHLVEWRNTIPRVHVFDSERAALIREYGERGDMGALREGLETWAADKRAQGRGSARGGVLG